MSLGEKALALVITVTVALIIYRGVSYWITGFFVSDEFGYYYDALHGSVYGGRLFFGWFNIAAFRFFQISTVDGFAFFLPFYLFFWSALAISAYYKVLRILKFSERTVALSLFSSLFLVSYVLLSLGFLTDSVGLSLVMVGIYFLLKFGNAHEGWRMLAYSFLALLFFGAASYTREPYSILLIGGALPVLFLGVTQVRNRGRNNSSIRHRRALGAVLILTVVAMYVGGTVYFVEFSPSPLFGQLSAAGGGFTGIFGNPIQITTVTIHSSTTASGTTQSTTTASTTGQTTKSVSATSQTTTSTSQITTTASTTQGNGTAVISLNPEAINTIQIFFGGIVLGWGPVLAFVAAVGLISLFRGTLHKRQAIPMVVLFLALLSLGSYFVVSAIFSPDPGYLSFTNYSTIIRFSDTATPAYFLLAPFAILHFTSKRRAMMLVATLIIFALIAIPVYEVYASSNFAATGVNPLGLNYRSPSVLVRDYINSHPGQEFMIVGVPYAWPFTPGVQDLKNTTVYALSSNTVSLFLNYSQFISLKWNSFYLYAGPPIPGTTVTAVDIYELFHSRPPSEGTSLPYVVIGSQNLIDDNRFTFVRIQLSWV